jgi:flagellar assembly protein FliH
VAQKVISSELTSNKDYIINLVVQALDKCSSRNNIKLKVSPDDFVFLSENKEKLSSLVDVERIEIKNDLSLKPGACIIETPIGNVDGGVQTKLHKIEDAFREILVGR